MIADTEVEVLLTIFGAILCLGGWTVFWVGSRLLGVTLGIGFGFFFGNMLVSSIQVTREASDLVTLSCSILGGIGGLLLIRAVTSFLFVVIGFLFGALIGRAGADVYFDWIQAPFEFNSVTIAVIIACALGLGLLALWLQKHIMIVITSYVGAAFLVGGIAVLRQFDSYSFVILFFGAVLWQVFLVTNLLEDKKPKPKQPE